MARSGDRSNHSTSPLVRLWAAWCERTTTRQRIFIAIVLCVLVVNVLGLVWRLPDQQQQTAKPKDIQCLLAEHAKQRDSTLLLIELLLDQSLIPLSGMKTRRKTTPEDIKSSHSSLEFLLKAHASMTENMIQAIQKGDFLPSEKAKAVESLRGEVAVTNGLVASVKPSLEQALKAWYEENLKSDLEEVNSTPEQRLKSSTRRLDELIEDLRNLGVSNKYGTTPPTH